MLSHVVCLAVTLGAVMAAVPPRCCFSNQYRSSMFVMNATLAPGSTTPEIWDNVLDLVFDYDNKKLAVNMSFADPASGQSYNVSVWEDYSASIRYILAGGECKRSPLDHDMVQPCVPGDFSFTGSYSIGSTTNRIPVEAFKGRVGQETLVFHVTDQCTPVSITQYGNNGKASEALQYLFRDVSTTIDPAALVVPDICKQSQPGAVGKRDVEHVQNLRSLLKLKPW